MNLNLLIRLREQGWTQKKLAHKVNLGESEISKIIRGRLNPLPVQRKRLAKALDCTEGELFQSEANYEQT